MKKSAGRLFWILSLLLLITVRGENEIMVGTLAPALKLKGVDGQLHALEDYRGKFVVLEWTNYECPFTLKHYQSGNMQALQKEFVTRGVIWLSICSSGPGKQGNYPAAEIARRMAAWKSSATQYLIDDTGEVGRRYEAKTTPSFFVINPAGLLIYSGAIDSIRSPDPQDIPQAVNYVRTALNEAMKGKPLTHPSTSPYGCAIKYP